MFELIQLPYAMEGLEVVVIDMGRQLCLDDRAYYNETLENRQVANKMRS